MIYTDEQYEILKQAIPHFNSVKQDYIRNAPKWLTEEIIEVYEIATGKTVMNKNLNCSICVLNIYKSIGRTFESDTKEREKLKSEVTVEVVDKATETTENTEEVKSKKRGRPKKTK